MICCNIGKVLAVTRFVFSILNDMKLDYPGLIKVSDTSYEYDNSPWNFKNIDTYLLKKSFLEKLHLNGLLIPISSTPFWHGYFRVKIKFNLFDWFFIQSM